jgi:tetratricopeptide (TPR) repeat protein
LLWIVLLVSAVSAQSQELCGGPLSDNNFGRPLDYTSDFDKFGFSDGAANKLELVESFHFDRDVEMLVAGMQGPLPGDIHYTLKHFPNHYRALYSMAQWHLKNPNPKQEECDCLDWLLTAECYFTRAITFKPEDPTLFYIYGLYLHKKGDLESAVDAYNDAGKLGLDTAEYHYNLGLLLVDMGHYEDARSHAKSAYGKGVTFPGLKRKLEALGQW